MLSRPFILNPLAVLPKSLHLFPSSQFSNMFKISMTLNQLQFILYSCCLKRGGIHLTPKSNSSVISSFFSALLFLTRHPINFQQVHHVLISFRICTLLLVCLGYAHRFHFFHEYMISGTRKHCLQGVLL